MYFFFTRVVFEDSQIKIPCFYTYPGNNKTSQCNAMNFESGMHHFPVLFPPLLLIISYPISTIAPDKTAKKDKYIIK